MKIPSNTADRYVSSVERETERNSLYAQLLTAQQDRARAGLSGTSTLIDELQAKIDAIDGQGDL